MLTAACDRFDVIQRLRRCNAGCEYPVGFGAIINCFVRNDRNYTPRRQFLGTRMVLN